MVAVVARATHRRLPAAGRQVAGGWPTCWRWQHFQSHRLVTVSARAASENFQALRAQGAASKPAGVVAQKGSLVCHNLRLQGQLALNRCCATLAAAHSTQPATNCNRAIKAAGLLLHCISTQSWSGMR